MKPKNVAVSASALAVAALVCAPLGAQAQDANQNANTAASGSAAGAPATAPATAPADTSQNGAAAGAGGAGELQEVVVTAERRATDVQQTPIAVTAVSGDQLQSLHLNTISDLQTTVPSFQSNDSGGFFNSINIRGMGNTAITPTIATGVAVFRDGLLMSETIAEDEPMFDIADTEILEGPQGTFVGASSTAGAVEINSANPNFNGLSGYALMSLANYSHTKWQGAVNLPATDTLAFRFAFNDEQRGSFYKDIGSTLNGFYYNQYAPPYGAPIPMNQGTPAQSLPITDPGHLNSRQARLKALWKPTDKFQFLGQAEYSFINTGGEPGEPNPSTYQTLFSAGPENPALGLQAGCAVGAGPLNPKQETCAGAGASQHAQYWYPGETPFVLDYYGTGQQEDELLTHYSAELRYTLSDGIVLRSLSGFVHIDINHQDNNSYGPQNAGWTYHEIGPNDNYMSEEINILSPTSGRLNWIAGAFWNYRDTPVFLNNLGVSAPYQPNQLPSTEAFIQAPSVNRIAAVFAQINWQFTDTLQLQVGARQNWDNNFSSNVTNVAVPGSNLPSPYGTGVYALSYTGNRTTPSNYHVLAPIAAAGRFKDSVPTGKVDLNWTPVPGQNFYAFYARGYKSGGANSSSTGHPFFSPEHVNDYELGWKGRLFNGHTLTQVGAYYVNYQNMQYPLFDTVAQNDTQTGTYTANLAASTIYGLEVSEQSRFGGLGVNIGFDYNHSALGAVLAVPSYALPPGFGSPVSVPQCLPGHTYSLSCFDYTPYLVNVSGEENPFAPRITANISVDYLFHFGNGTIDPRVTYSHTDQQYASIFEVPYNLMQARNLIDASIDWNVDKWDLQLFGTNLTNQLYIIAGGNPVYYGPPRQAGVQATYHF
jgi:iron complex outermembrane receptor protein